MGGAIFRLPKAELEIGFLLWEIIYAYKYQDSFNSKKSCCKARSKVDRGGQLYQSKTGTHTRRVYLPPPWASLQRN
ncbi:MAG: hypothetical protein CVU50_03380 [Candidatus Cloacimonetes bacterium HGW-Cloacimonetes-3]|nr:MAG: hypothetical protein CVU50_03380 [Candidatus Cloacimonetes bacterium HGW-Cloacimonetes-3]